MYRIILKLAIAALLFGSFIHVPDQYYQLGRISIFIGFGTLIVTEYHKGHKLSVLGLFAILIIYQPFSKIPFSPFFWHTLDVLLGIFLVFWVILDMIARSISEDDNREW